MVPNGDFGISLIFCFIDLTGGFPFDVELNVDFKVDKLFGVFFTIELLLLD